MTIAIFVSAGLLVVGLVAWTVAAQRAKRRAEEAAIERLGFRPCPDRNAWLQETIGRMENNKGYRYEVTDPMRLGSEPAVYQYIKVRHEESGEHAIAGREILFPLKRPSSAGLVLFVKPTALASGRATRFLGAVATGPWEAQPDDLARLEIPQELKETNLLGALAPAGASLYELVDSRTLGVVQGLGDAGALTVRFRDAWCAVEGAGSHGPFRIDEIVNRVRPLL